MRKSILLFCFLHSLTAFAAFECEFFLEGRQAEAPIELMERIFKDAQTPGFASVSQTATRESLRTLGLPRRLPKRLRMDLGKVEGLEQVFAVHISGARREWTRYIFHIPPVFLWHWVENGALHSAPQFETTALDTMSIGTVMATADRNLVRKYISLQLNSAPYPTLVVTMGLDVDCAELRRFSQAEPRFVMMMTHPGLTYCRVEVIRARLGLAK